MGLLAQTFNALERQSIIRDVQLFKVQIMEKHLLQTIISDMIIDQIENPQPLRKILGNVEQ